jgi:hypothetical protein
MWKSRPLIAYIKLANCRHALEYRVEAHVAWILLFSAIFRNEVEQGTCEMGYSYACKVSNKPDSINKLASA